jgi:hypothetical protein
MFLGLLDPDPGPLVRALFFFHFFLLFDFLSLKNYVKEPSKSNMQKTFFSIGILKVNNENRRIRIRIQIHKSKAWIHGSGSTPK